MMKTCLKSFIVYLLLASFLIVQADLPLVRASMEHAAATGKCVPDECGCSLNAQQGGNCCCASKPAPTTGFALRAADCADDATPGDASIVLKFQIDLPVLATVHARLPDRVVFSFSSDTVAPRIPEPPDPPPKLALSPSVAA